MKPYVVATGAILADAPYMGGIGGGLTVHAKAGNVSLDPYAEIVQQSFRSSTFYPLATGLSGTLSTVGVRPDPFRPFMAIARRFCPRQRPVRLRQL